MKAAIIVLCAVAPAAAFGQTFNDVLVQAPELAAPERGSIVGSLAGFKLSAATLSRGDLSLPLPLELPDERGALLFAFAPTYGLQGGQSEWGMGWSANLRIHRYRELGSIDYSSADQLSSPWGELKQGTDGFWYPAGFSPLLRLERLSSGWLAQDGQGTQWRFEQTQAGAGGEFAWYLTNIRTALGAKTEIIYRTNGSGRPFIDEVVYGDAVNPEAQRVQIEYAPLADPFVDYRSGAPVLLDQRVAKVIAQVQDTHGNYLDRWSYDLGFAESATGPAFYLTSISRTYASGDREPPVTYNYDIDDEALANAEFTPAPGLAPYLQVFGMTALQPTRATLTDIDQDGRVDIESHQDFRLFRQTDTGWQWESTPPAASPYPSCWPNFGSFNPPRHLMRVTPGQRAPQVLAALFQPTGFTELALCERDGMLIDLETVQGDWRTGPTARITDIDRDQRPDLLRVFAGSVEVVPNESGPSDLRFGAPVVGALSPIFTPNAVWLQDLNGDGLVDLVARGGGTLVMWPGIGAHRFETTAQSFLLWLSGGVPFSAWSSYGLSFVDANRDGLADILMSNAQNAILFTNRLGRFAQVEVPGFWTLGGNLRDPVIADLSGSGEAEVIATVGLDAYTMTLTRPSTGLLVSVDDGKGNWLALDYVRAAAAPGVEQRHVVLESSLDSASGADSVTTSYGYAAPKTHSLSRRLLGFERVDVARPSESEVHLFEHTDAQQGIPVRVERRDPDIADLYDFRNTRYLWRTHLGLDYPRPSEQESGFGRDSDGLEHAIRVFFEAHSREFCPTQIRTLNPHGELIETSALASPSGLIPELHCLAEELHFAGDHRDPQLDFVEGRRITRNALGQLLRVSRLAPAGSRLEQEVTYDALGRVEAVTDPKLGVTRFDYDPVTGVLSAVEKHDGVRVEVNGWEPLSGKPIAMSTLRGPGGDFVQHFRFDGRERLASSWNSADGSSSGDPAKTFAYQEPGFLPPRFGLISTKTRIGPGRYRTDLTYLNARGHTLAKGLLAGPDLVFSDISLVFSAQRSISTFSPGHVPSTIPEEQVLFAELLMNAAPVGLERTSAFGFTDLEQVTYDAQTFSEIVTTRSVGPLGIEVVSTDRSGAAISDVQTASGLTLESRDQAGAVTRYTHDAAGRLRVVELPSGLRHTVDYDALGDVRRIVRNEVGELEFFYDPVGRLSKTVLMDSAQNVVRVVTHEYDGAGRLIRQEHEDSGGTRELFTLEYDGAGTGAPGQKGRLSRVTGPGFVRTQEYNANDTLSREVWTFPGWRIIELELSYREDASIRESRRMIRDAQSGAVLETIIQSYPIDAYGRPSGLELNGAPVYTLHYRSDGQLERAQLSTGGTLSWHHDADTKRIRGLDKIAGGLVSEVHWDWNERGQIDRQQIAVAGQTMSDAVYTYDPRGFVTRVDDRASIISETWSYDADGRLVEADDRLGHRPSIWSGPLRQVGSHEFEYDLAGRVIRRDALEVDYGPNGHVARLTDTASGRSTTYRYDESGERILKKDSSGQLTAYLAGGILTAAGWTERVEIGGHTVGLIRGGVFEPLFTDLRNSLVEETSGVYSGLSAYGTRTGRGPDHEVLDYNNQGFDLDLQTVRFGVRDYDPLLGEFMTPDPLFLLDPGRCVMSPIDCNLYSYARNNPVSMSDRTGTFGDLDQLLKGAFSGGGNVYSPMRAGLNQAALRWTIDASEAGARAALFELSFSPFGPALDAYELVTGRTVLGDEASRGWAVVGLVTLGVGKIFRGPARAGSEILDATADNRSALSKTADLLASPCGCFVDGTSVKAGDEPAAIETIRVGDRVRTASDLGTPSKVDEGWSLVALELEGERAEITVLRPPDWIERNGVTEGQLLWFGAEELGVQGWAKILDLREAPALEEGTGQVVVGTYSLVRDNLFEVTFEGGQAPLRGTGSHLLYSRDREGWASLESLRPGERLQSPAGEAVVMGLEPLPGFYRVHNIEVEHAHEYLVGEEEIRAHNFCWGRYLEKVLGVPKPQGMKNPHAHHIVFKGDFSHWGPEFNKMLDASRAKLKSVGINPLYGKENLVWAPNEGHSQEAVKAVYEALQKAGTKRQVIQALKRLGNRFADGEFRVSD